MFKKGRRREREGGERELNKSGGNGRRNGGGGVIKDIHLYCILYILRKTDTHVDIKERVC